MSIDARVKWRSRARKLGFIVGAAGIGLIIGAIPFVSPALRKYCLPYVPATPTQVSRVLSLVSRGPPSRRVIDLGSGDGRVVISLAKQGHFAMGVEVNYWLVLASRLRAVYNGVYWNTKFYWKDLWKLNLNQYDVIVIFGVEDMMGPLGTKIEKEAIQGCRVIACRFHIPQWTPETHHDDGPNSVWTYEINKPTTLL